MKVTAIIQARMGSSRLPGKVMQDLAGEPILTRVFNRVNRARTIDEVVIATSVEESDGAIEEFCEERRYPCFRGSHNDVLDRFYKAAKSSRADVLVRITADCPLIEPSIIDKVVDSYFENSVEFSANTRFQPRSFPVGLDAEAMSFGALEKAWHEDNNLSWREHVTPYLYRTGLFKVFSVVNPEDYSHMRWAVDAQADLDFVRLVYSEFRDDTFSWEEVLELLKENPDWLQINRDVGQKHGWQV